MDLPIGERARVRAPWQGCACACVCGHGVGESPAGQMGTAKGLTSAPWSSFGLSAPSLDRSTAVAACGSRRPGPRRSPPALPPVAQNMELVGKLQVDTPAAFRFNPATGQPDPGQPAVVRRADRGRGGLQERGLSQLVGGAELQARRLLLGRHLAIRRTRSSSRSSRRWPARYHGEGAHVITLDIPGGFKGDVLAVNNEPCDRQRRRRLRPLRRQQPGQPADPGAGRGRPVGRPRRGQSVRAGHAEPGASEQRALDLHLAGRRTRLTRSSWTTPSSRRRHLRHHEPARAGVHHRRRPVRARDRPGHRHRRRPRPTATRSSTTTWSSRRSTASRTCSSPTGTPVTSSSTSPTRRTRRSSATPTSGSTTRS